jgi:hypothetical protein
LSNFVLHFLHRNQNLAGISSVDENLFATFFILFRLINWILKGELLLFFVGVIVCYVQYAEKKFLVDLVRSIPYITARQGDFCIIPPVIYTEEP